jgi:hypothetical protein
VQIVGEKVEPLPEPALVQQIGFLVEKLLDLLLEPEIGQIVFHSRSPGWRGCGAAAPGRVEIIAIFDGNRLADVVCCRRRVNSAAECNR